MNEQSGHVRVESCYPQAEPDGKKPIPCAVPTHDTPDVAGTNRPATGKSGKEKIKSKQEIRPSLQSAKSREEKGGKASAECCAHNGNCEN